MCNTAVLRNRVKGRTWEMVKGGEYADRYGGQKPTLGSCQHAPYHKNGQHVWDATDHFEWFRI